MKRSSYRLALAAAIVAALVPTGRTAMSQTAVIEDANGPNGLWRDADGKLWCGGDCNPGQRCCTISY